MIELPHKLLINVHDVMPETLPEVRPIVEAVERNGRGPATLLVVPGREWRASQLDELRRWRERGHELAGHGWTHRSPRFRGLWRRLNGPSVSDEAAEHLGLDGPGIVDLLRRCRRWFDHHELGRPSLYVPPAWAMGRVRRLDIRGAGFRFFEYAGGFYDARIGVYQRVPRLRFAADSALQEMMLRGWNRHAIASSRRYGWLRVAIHPRDPARRLGDALAGLLDGLDGRAAVVSELFDDGPPRALPATRRARARGGVGAEPSRAS